MPDDITLSIDPALAAPMIVRLTPPTAAFDLERAVPCDAGAPYVEFYDRRYLHEPGFTSHGQFIVRYCATTLLDRPDGALILNEAVPQWSIDPRTMGHVRDWLRTQLERQAPTDSVA